MSWQLNVDVYFCRYYLLDNSKKKDKRTTLYVHLLCILNVLFLFFPFHHCFAVGYCSVVKVLFCSRVLFLHVSIPACFDTFYRSIPNWKEVLQKLFPLVIANGIKSVATFEVRSLYNYQIITHVKYIPHTWGQNFALPTQCKCTTPNAQPHIKHLCFEVHDYCKR